MASAVGAMRAPSLTSLRADTLLASAALNLAALAVPVLMLQLYDRIIPNAAYSTLAALLVGVAAAIALEAALRHARTAIAAWVAAQEEHALSRAALTRVLNADPRGAPPPGELADAMSAIAEWRAHRTGPLAFALADLPFALLFLGFLAWVSPLLSGVAVLAAMPGLVAAMACGPLAARAVADRTRAETLRYALAHEAVAAIEPLKAMGAEAQMLRRHERLVATSATAGRRTAFAAQLCQALSGTAMQTVIAAMALAGAWLMMRGEVSGGGAAAAILLASRGIEPLARLAAATPTVVRARDARRRIGMLLDLRQEREGGADPGELREVLLRGVGLAAPGGGWLLRNASLRVGRGECIAVQGAGGAGKTRLLLAIAGLVPPEAGRVFLNGRPREELSPPLLRRQTALLTQLPSLVPGRVADILTGFDPTQEKAAMALAAELGLPAYFDRLPDGYATTVGRSEAQDLPPSVAERVAAVRALVSGPRLILFDDAAASQDRDGDRRMRAAIARLKPEAIIVLATDRAEWLALADRRYRIAGGQLVEAESI